MQEVPHVPGAQVPRGTPGYAAAHNNNVYASPPPNYRMDEDMSSEGKKSDPELAPVDKTTTVQEGHEKFHRLGWKRLTICLIVEAIALGSLSIPSAFAKLGMVAGVIMCVGLGLV